MPSTTTTGSNRIASVDILRGIVMVIMALDHVREFMGHWDFALEDPSETSVALFFTRWITHFCAPTFIFLAGTSAFLYKHYSGSTTKQVSHFLLTRGLWILFTEIFILNVIVQGYPDPLILQVLWAIGWSMICLAGLVYLPRNVILAFGLLMIFGHNLLDGIHPRQFGDFSWLWKILHFQGTRSFGDFEVLFYYPLIPWVGVMACGYVFGEVILKPKEIRGKELTYLGIICLTLFLVLRIFNIYGDPNPWHVVEGRSFIFSLLSFLNVTKYPPSLLFLLLTLGISFLLMPRLESLSGKVANFFMVFGRVPFFYYLLHFALIHAIAIAWSMSDFIPFAWFPEAYHLSLPWIFGVWIAVVFVLYPICKWYMNYKRAHKSNRWLSYV